MIPRGSPAAASGGGSVGTGDGPALGSKRAKAARVKVIREKRHSHRVGIGPKPSLLSDVMLAGGAHSSGRD